jgi:hypothetical protein
MATVNIVKFKLNTRNSKLVSAAQRKRLAAVAAMPDTAIDCSDIPRQSGAVQRSRPGALASSENKQ